MDESPSSKPQDSGPNHVHDLDRLQERFQFLVDSLSEACFGIDFSWRYIFFNSTAELMTGLKKEEILGRDIRKVFPGISGTPLFQKYQQVMNSRAHQRVVGGLTLPNGRKGHFAININPIPEGIICLVNEVDSYPRVLEELKESEAFFMALLNAPRDYAILVSGFDDKIMFINDAAKEIFGYSRKELVGSQIDSLIPSTEWRSLVDQKDPGKNLRQTHEADLTRKGGDVFPALMYTYPVPDKVGVLIARVTIVQDLTSRKEMESRRILTARYKAIGELTKDIAHNFNNLLGSIMGSAQILQRKMEKYGDPKVQRMADQLVQAGNRMSKLVQDMLAFTGIMDSISGPSQTTGNLDAILRNAIHYIQPFLDQHMTEQNIRIILTYKADEFPVLDYLSENFRSAVIQILLNAIEAMEHDGTIAVTGEWPVKDPGGEDHVVVEFADQGKGMNQETLSRAVEPLFSTKQKVGVGIGLTTAYGIINRLGGTLEMESEQGKGTTVRVILPAPGKVKNNQRQNMPL